MSDSTGSETYDVIAREIMKMKTNSKGIVSLYLKFTLLNSVTSAYLNLHYLDRNLTFSFDGVDSSPITVAFKDRRERPVCSTLFLVTAPDAKNYVPYTFKPALDPFR